MNGLKVGDPKGSKWAVQNTESERFKKLKVDGHELNERSKKVRMEGELRIRVQLGSGCT